MSDESATEYTDANGVRYVARDADGGASCSGCAHRAIDGAWRFGACVTSPNCQSDVRADGRDIIWVRADSEGDQ